MSKGEGQIIGRKWEKQVNGEGCVAEEVVVD